MDRLIIAAMMALCSGAVMAAPPSATATPVMECGAVLSEPGNYKLANDLLACPGFAITIAASDVSLNLMGRLVTCDREDGRFDVGIEVLDVVNARITNGRISDCDIGIELFQSRESKVSNMILQDNVFDPYIGGFGIVGFEANGNEIVGNDASRNTIGIELFFGGNNRITGNIANDNARSENSPLFPSFGVGIGIAFSDDNVVTGNETSRNTDAGIALANGSTGNVVRDNSANGNGFYGIGMFSREDVPAPLATGNTIQSNESLGNGRADMLEARFDPFADPREIVQETCMNEWKDNIFISQIAPENCVH